MPGEQSTVSGKSAEGYSTLQLGLERLRLEVNEKRGSDERMSEAPTETNVELPSPEKPAEPETENMCSCAKTDRRPHHHISGSCGRDQREDDEGREESARAVRELEAEREEMKQIRVEQARSQELEAQLQLEKKARDFAHSTLAEAQKRVGRRDDQLNHIRQAFSVSDVRCAMLERQNFALLEALSTICGYPTIPQPPSHHCQYGLQPQAMHPAGEMVVGNQASFAMSSRLELPQNHNARANTQPMDSRTPNPRS